MVSFGNMRGQGRGSPLLSGSTEAQLKFNVVISMYCVAVAFTKIIQKKSQLQTEDGISEGKKERKTKKDPLCQWNLFFKKDRKLSHQKAFRVSKTPLLVPSKISCQIEYYSAIKRNKIELFVVRWKDLETVIQREVSQKEKNKYRMLTHIYGM